MLFRKRKKKDAKEASEVVESAVVSANSSVVVYGGDGNSASAGEQATAQQSVDSSAPEAAASVSQAPVSAAAPQAQPVAGESAQGAQPAAVGAEPAPAPAQAAQPTTATADPASAPAQATQPAVAASQGGQPVAVNAPQASQPAAANAVQPTSPVVVPMGEKVIPLASPGEAVVGSIASALAAEASAEPEQPQSAAPQGDAPVDAASWERVASIAQKLEHSPASNAELAGLAVELERIVARNVPSESTYAAQSSRAQGHDTTYAAQAATAKSLGSTYRAQVAHVEEPQEEPVSDQTEVIKPVTAAEEPVSQSAPAAEEVTEAQKQDASTDASEQQPAAAQAAAESAAPVQAVASAQQGAEAELPAQQAAATNQSGEAVKPAEAEPVAQQPSEGSALAQQSASQEAQSTAHSEGVLPDWAPSDDKAQELVDSFFNAPVDDDATSPFVIPRGQHVQTQEPLVFRGAMADAASGEQAPAAQPSAPVQETSVPTTESEQPSATPQAPAAEAPDAAPKAAEPLSPVVEAPAASEPAAKVPAEAESVAAAVEQPAASEPAPAAESHAPSGRVIKFESLGSAEVASLSSVLSEKPAEPASAEEVVENVPVAEVPIPDQVVQEVLGVSAPAPAEQETSEPEISFLEAEKSIGLSMSEMVELESLGEALKKQLNVAPADEPQEESVAPHAEKTIALESVPGLHLESVAEVLGRSAGEQAAPEPAQAEQVAVSTEQAAKPAPAEPEPRVMPSSLAADSASTGQAQEEAQSTDEPVQQADSASSSIAAASAAAGAFARSISEPLPRLRVNEDNVVSVAQDEPAVQAAASEAPAVEDDEIVKSLFAAEREAEAKKEAERAAQQAAAAVATEYEPKDGSFAISADQAAPAFAPDGTLASDALGEEVSIVSEEESPKPEEVAESVERERRRYAGFPEQEAAGALDSTEPRAANMPSFVYVTAPAFEPEQGTERPLNPSYERDRHAAADYEAERKAAELRNRAVERLIAEGSTLSYDTSFPPVDYDAFEEAPKKKKKKGKKDKDKKGKKKKGKKGKKMKKEKDKKRDKQNRDDDAPATFRQLYASRDGKLAIYEDAEGHIISVDTNRLS
ncbi:hypothetical protein [Denitrobacterium detoxificans]|uniref:Uncharacterized protein n=1 Tax=Denitrobacterium detoxificans TaxID=79604 RepID=A0A1H8QA41_9ACTN|nr:hypothetical protein [Denitrobacterium detoxificans]SEO50878.1 hypothetical protein SAMN02910314_00388 [Denitrobacterium detoxificans]